MPHFLIPQTIERVCAKNDQREDIVTVCHFPIHILGECHPGSPAFPGLPSYRWWGGYQHFQIKNLKIKTKKIK